MIELAVSYGMFTEAGDQAVDRIVRAARRNNWTWKETYQVLYELSDDYDRYGEALDTVVREAVYTALGYHQRGQNFYI